MTPDELRSRLALGEGMHTDFKRQLGANRELEKDIVCFANTDGGQLLIGVADDGTMVGVDDPDQVMVTADDVAFQGCRPPVSIVPETVTVDGVTVVCLNVPKGDQRPYSTGGGTYYVRSGARCRQASRSELLRMFQASDSLFTDERPLTRLALADLDLDEVQRHAAASGLDVDGVELTAVLRAWRAFDGSHPTLAGLVCFGRMPQRDLEASRVVVGAYAGTDTGDDLTDRKDLSGGLFEVIEQVETFLNLHLPSRHTIRGFESERDFDIPPAALREAVVNALVHRDYTIPAAVRVFVLTDRVEVHAPGRPPNTVDEAAMRAGVHVPRNPHIYSRVADGQLATRAGTGIRRISRLVREASGEDIAIRVSDAETVVLLPRKQVAPPNDGNT